MGLQPPSPPAPPARTPMSIRHAFDTLELYEKASAARVNNSKCKGLWAGAFKHRTDQLLGFDWFNDYIPEKILGLYFDNVDCMRLNLQPRTSKINNTITAWYNRNLSFKGKTLVINGLLTSVLWYHATALPIPAWAVRDIEQSTVPLSFFLVKQNTPGQEGHACVTTRQGRLQYTSDRHQNYCPTVIYLVPLP